MQTNIISYYPFSKEQNIYQIIQFCDYCFVCTRYQNKDFKSTTKFPAENTITNTFSIQ